MFREAVPGPLPADTRAVVERRDLARRVVGIVERNLGEDGLAVLAG